MDLDGQRVLVTGGTGTLGEALVRRLLTGSAGRPAKVTVFSRDEAKQHEMRLSFLHFSSATDEVIYRNSRDLLSFRIGDVRNYESVLDAVRDVDVIFNAAALKQVPTCEYFPSEAIETNVMGAQNIVRAVRDAGRHVRVVVAVSTDKACKPINVMGMTKALQERVFVEANLRCPGTRFVCVRYGNVLASRGSVIPLFLEQIRRGGPVTITLEEMTRFLLTLDRAVDTVLAAAGTAQAGETYIPRVPSARIVDLAAALIGDRDIATTTVGIRPGEKIHEIMISEEECYRTTERGDYYAILPMLPELRAETRFVPALSAEYSSANDLMDVNELRDFVSGFVAKTV
jgi:UDP-glucose 4-epimerase